MAKSIYILNGPNLNLLGTREPDVYGHATLSDVERICRVHAKALNYGVEFRQSNHEGDLVDWLHEARAKKAVGVVINPGAFTHTSIAILDAVIAAELPVVEVHISNIYAREDFRRHSHISKVAKAVVCGFGIDGYRLAISGLAALIDAKS
jgi:3-dehydroquinate dehydratase-2